MPVAAGKVKVTALPVAGAARVTLPLVSPFIFKLAIVPHHYYIIFQVLPEGIVTVALADMVIGPELIAFLFDVIV